MANIVMSKSFQMDTWINTVTVVNAELQSVFYCYHPILHPSKAHILVNMYHTGISNCALSLEQMLEDFILPRTSSRGHKFAGLLLRLKRA